jgi:uncharacterized zinc-type alcohol dehydrogenase-like protein
MFHAKAYSAASATSPLAPTTIARRDPTPRDVQIEILFCGICHSDLHTVRNEWSSLMSTVYPCVPGHEVVGRVTRVGSAVTKFAPGDLAGVGCLVDSDRTCPECQAGLEQFCPGQTLTYNSPDKHPGGVTYGGYIQLLRRDRTLTLVGAPEKPSALAAFGLILGRRSISGSPIGGIPETQEMLDFCGKHGITADVEVIPAQKVNEAYERMLRSDVKYRFSIDMHSLKAA